MRPYSLPVETAQASTPGVLDKGKGKEKEIPVFNTASPAADTPGAGGDGEEEDNQGKLGKKWKNNYKHLIKGIPGTSTPSCLLRTHAYLLHDRQAYHKEGRLFNDHDASTTKTAYNHPPVRPQDATRCVLCEPGRHIEGTSTLHTLNYAP